MCGIVGYVGARVRVQTLLDGLKRLEYRGYDSAGIAVIEDGRLHCIKESGKVARLEQKIKTEWPSWQQATGSVGIAHTRWATHGPPTTVNAHPHLDSEKRFAIVHNGIIDNYAALKARLIERGRKFVSDTDSEVLVNLIAECYDGDIFQATAAALKQVDGTFGIAVIALDHPDLMVVARRGSPIVIGVGKEENIVASDIAAIVAYTQRVIFLNDDDIAMIRKDSIDIRSIDNIPVAREVAKIDWNVAAAEKSGFDHFMLKEIFEQPESLANAIRGRIDFKTASTILTGMNMCPREISQVSRIIIPACGTSLHAGMVGDYFFEDLAGIPTEVTQAAEFRYRNPIIEPNTLIIPISQSGETLDTLEAVREAVNKGATVTALCNVVGSTIAREAGSGIYIHAGPEIGVASTKAFTCQVAVLLLIATLFGRTHRLPREQAVRILEELEKLPSLVQQVLDSADSIRPVAEKYAGANNFFYIGRYYLYPVALEGALKLKEISYIHAEGYHAAELKHGPIALLEKTVPVMAMANDIPGKDKILGNMQECKARQAPVICTGTVGDDSLRNYATDILWIPACSKYLAPVVTVVALQLFAYYVAKCRGCEIDQPRNLAKSVTVE